MKMMKKFFKNKNLFIILAFFNTYIIIIYNTDFYNIKYYRIYL